ncbi:MAG: pyridoxal-phosphate dependent enzyme [Pelobium sp.]
MINLEFNSPEEEIRYPPITDHIRLFFKRDDLIHPFISGNKWRKLKYHLLKAKEEHKSHLVTFGGAYSNHLLATACAGAKFGFKTTAFVRGEEADNQLLDLCKLYGMNLLPMSRVAYQNKQDLFHQYFKNHSYSYFIDEGGFGVEAAKGCREIIEELNQTYDHIFCAAGTGATSAGIINEIVAKNLSSIFNMIPVLKGASFLKKDIQPLLLNPAATYQIHEDYHFGGYAKTTPELISFIKDFSQKTGILIDPVYTGKVLFAIQDLVNTNYFKKGDAVLMIHTGGMFGILGMLDKFK